MNLPHRLDRTITIHAPRETVFAFFTDNARWASWWGAGSTIEPRVGGRVSIRYPGSVLVSGEVLEVRPPEHLRFTYGYDSGQPFGPGGSEVAISLEAIGGSTRLNLTHHFPDAASRDQHVQGWRYQLSLFGNAVLDVVHAGADRKIDAWFGLWAEPDLVVRAATIAEIASAAVAFRDRYSLVDGREDLSAHIAAAQHFMPGIVIARRGPVRMCQGTAIVDWTAVGADGVARGQGSNVFVLGADGRIESATGFWG